MRAEASISLKGYRFDAAREWSEIRRHEGSCYLVITPLVTDLCYLVSTLAAGTT